MKISLTSLCATYCALLNFLSPAHGQYNPCDPAYQDDTCYLWTLITNPNAPQNGRGQRMVTIPPKAGGGDYNTHPLRLPGDLELTLEEGVVIQDTANVFTELFGQPANPLKPCDSPSPWADHRNPDAEGGKFNKLFLAKDVSNLTIIGEGADESRATLQMRGAPEEYPSCSNFVHALDLIDVKNVDISNLNIKNTGGDGIHIWNGDIVNVRNCTINNANRNGIAIVSGTDITVEDCVLTGTGGKSPQAGMDIEPSDSSNNNLVRIRIKRCTAEGNALRGFFVNLAQLNHNSAPVDVRFENCVVNGSLSPAAGYGFHVRGDNDSINNGGSIEFINCSVIDPGPSAPSPSSDWVLVNHLNFEWDLRSLITLKFVGLNLEDNRDDRRCSVTATMSCTSDDQCPPSESCNSFPNKLIKFTVRDWEQVPLAQRPHDRIVIKGTVTKETGTTSIDPVIEVVRLCTLANVFACTGVSTPFACCTGVAKGSCGTLQCNDNGDCSVAGCAGMGVPYSCCTGVGTGNCVPSCLHSGNCGTCPDGVSYPEISGCLAIGDFTDGDAAQLPNLSVPDVTPICGNSIEEACEECDPPNAEACDNCYIVPTTPIIYARWDDGGSLQPEEDTDYRIIGAPDSPDVELLTGHNDWRVWSVHRNPLTDIADLGVLSSPVAQDFKVKLVRPDGAPAARHVKGITLVPTDPAKYSNIVAGEIAGDLGSDGLVLKNSAEQAGAASLTIGGNVSGNINIPKVDSLQIDGAVEAGSTITMNGIPQYAAVYLAGPLNGSINLDNQELRGLLSLSGGSAPGSQIVGGPLTGSLRFLADTSSGSATYSGSATFSSVGPTTGTITMEEGSTLAPGGTITISGDVDNGRLITFSGPIDDDFGTVTVGGQMNGDICASNLNPPPVPLPSNLHLAQFGAQGTICETPICAAQLDVSGPNRVRTISFSTTETAERAIRITFIKLHRVVPPYTGGPSVPFEAFEGQTVYVAAPQVRWEKFSLGTQFAVARTQSEPHFRDWSSFRGCDSDLIARICEVDADCLGNQTCTGPVNTVLHVFGPSLVPSSQYDVQLMPGENAACATTVSMFTNRWGDVEAPYETPGGCTVSNNACFVSSDCPSGETCTNPLPVTGQPNLSDVAALVNKFRSVPGAPIKARALLVGNDSFGDFFAEYLDQDLSFGHIGACVDAFRGKAYPHKAGRCEDSCNNLRGPDACAMDSDCMTGHCVLFCPD